MKTISTDPSDEFLEDKSIWVATLNNGEIVYQDDGRPGCNPPQAWLRLKSYIRENNLSLIDLHIKFRCHVEKPLSPYAIGYFFCNRAIRTIGSITYNFFIIGELKSENNFINTQIWKTPELVYCGYSARMLTDCKSDCLILNRKIYYDFDLGKPSR